MRRLLGGWLRPVWWVQAAVVWLNVPPFIMLFKRIYALGLAIMVRRLARFPEIHSIYGHGSFFDGQPLYGHSDVDLMIVFRETIQREMGVQHRVGRAYSRVRLFFPFLGRWSEKSASLVFLSETASGFPLPSSFRVRLREDRFTRLLGEPVPATLEGPPTTLELLDEIDTLVRITLMTSERWTRRQVFWQGIFRKLFVVAEKLAAPRSGPASGDDPELSFLGESSRRVFFRAADPDRLLGRFWAEVERINATVAERSETVTVSPRRGPDLDLSARTVPPPGFLGEVPVDLSVELPSVPLGLKPDLYYFAVDEPVRLVGIEQPSYTRLRELRAMLFARGSGRDAMLVRAGDTLVLMAWQPDYVDVQPLNPLVHAPAHALVAGRLDFTMPRQVFDDLQAEADSLYRATRSQYERHTGWLPTRDQPEILLEDDIDTIRDAFDHLRAYLARAPGGIVLGSSASVAAHLTGLHPETGPFFDALLEYKRRLEAGARGTAPASNLYRCLHQMVSQVLAGGTVALDDHDQRLGVTVGIITRNRADDLVHALDSLSRQARPPDQVVLVDNGSTDDTREVVASFEDRLPLEYEYLADASIPIARNRVLDLASHEIVAFTDDDCGIPHRWVQSVERAFLRADNVGLVGGWVAHWPAEEESAVDHYYGIFHGHKT